MTEANSSPLDGKAYTKLARKPERPTKLTDEVQKIICGQET
jgi:hypothetical protein